MDIVKAELVEGTNEIEKVVRAELYKLNVYGEYYTGGFRFIALGF